MDRLTPTIIVGSVIVLIFVGMYFGWRARSRKYRGLPALGPMPSDSGDTVAVDAGLYVATTVSGQPLERVAAHGLGFRSRAAVTVTRNGIGVALTGQEPFFISSSSLVAVGRATWAIDTAVEPGGLVVVTWRLAESELDSYFRMDNGPEVLLNAGAELIEGLG